VIVANKVQLARESRGMTQAELAPLLGISQGQLSKIELGVLRAPDSLGARLSAVLNYPESLFAWTDEVYGAGPNELYHRKQQSTSARLMRKIYAHINLRRMQITRLVKSIPLSNHITRFDVEDDPEGELSIARRVRAMWHLPDGPIRNATDIVERAGAVVIPCQFETEQVDGISQWLPGLPAMFFINLSAARSRWRMTIAHELAHIVMHARPNALMEAQAARFAGEFLMPAADIRGDLRILSGLRSADDCLSKLFHLKGIWHVSIQALVMRATDLGVLSKAFAQSIWKRIVQLNYKKREPHEELVPLERPSTLRELVGRHTSRLGFTVVQLAEALSLTTNEFRQLYMPEEIGHLRAVI